MDFDDDAPPELVDTAGQVQREDEQATVKVPITIVTGRRFPVVSLEFRLGVFSLGIFV